MNAEAKHPIKQGAIIGGWLCFAFGAAIMHFSLWGLPIYGPLLLAAFVLSIAAMSQRRIVGGILLLLTTLIVPPVQFFCTGDKFMEENLPGYKEAREQAKKDAKSIKEVMNAHDEGVSAASAPGSVRQAEESPKRSAEFEAEQRKLLISLVLCHSFIDG